MWDASLARGKAEVPEMRVEKGQRCSDGCTSHSDATQIEFGEERLAALLSTNFQRIEWRGAIQKDTVNVAHEWVTTFP